MKALWCIIALPFEMLSTPLGTAGLLCLCVIIALACGLGCAALSPKVGPVGPGGDGDATSAAAGFGVYQSAFGIGAVLVCVASLIVAALSIVALRRATLAAIDALYRSCPPEDTDNA